MSAATTTTERKAGHTPGPWGTSRDAVPAGHVQITVYAVATGNRVATAFEREGNADLIAAAPEMADALRDIAATLEQHPAASRGNSKVHFALYAARAALDKAGLR